MIIEIKEMTVRQWYKPFVMLSLINLKDLQKQGSRDYITENAGKILDRMIADDEEHAENNP